MKVSQFNKNYNFYKGDLHSHSTVSDGRLSPEELVKVYYERGYKFLVFTEHSIYSYWKELEQENFIVIPGVKIAIDEISRPRCYHFVGMSKFFSDKDKKERINEFYWNGPESIQKAINTMLELNVLTRMGK